jgi:two-component system cell cycle sensor histidine kinase/response regulator CckA
MRGDLSSGAETILLVDDEEPVQYLVRDILKRRGDRLLAASDGPAALRVSHAFQGDIHLLVTDILMPRMNGMEVATCLTAARPLMNVVYMSGHAETVVSEHGRMSRGRYFLRKPFLPPTLVRKIREVLDDHGCEMNEGQNA